MTFLSGGVAALTTARLSSRALRPVHLLFGGVALAFLLGYTFLGGMPVFDRLGEGGVERWIVYPVVLWTVVLDAGLASSRADSLVDSPLRRAWPTGASTATPEDVPRA